MFCVSFFPPICSHHMKISYDLRKDYSKIVNLPMIFHIPELFYISPLLCSQTQGIPQVWSTVTEPSAEGKNEDCPLFTVCDGLSRKQQASFNIIFFFSSFQPFPQQLGNSCISICVKFCFVIRWFGEGGGRRDSGYKFWMFKFMLLQEIHWIKLYFAGNILFLLLLCKVFLLMIVFSFSKKVSFKELFLFFLFFCSQTSLRLRSSFFLFKWMKLDILEANMIEII